MLLAFFKGTQYPAYNDETDSLIRGGWSPFSLFWTQFETINFPYTFGFALQPYFVQKHALILETVHQAQMQKTI